MFGGAPKKDPESALDAAAALPQADRIAVLEKLVREQAEQIAAALLQGERIAVLERLVREQAEQIAAALPQGDRNVVHEKLVKEAMDEKMTEQLASSSLVMMYAQLIIVYWFQWVKSYFSIQIILH